MALLREVSDNEPTETRMSFLGFRVVGVLLAVLAAWQGCLALNAFGGILRSVQVPFALSQFFIGAWAVYVLWNRSSDLLAPSAHQVRHICSVGLRALGQIMLGYGILTGIGCFGHFYRGRLFMNETGGHMPASGIASPSLPLLFKPFVHVTVSDAGFFTALSVLLATTCAGVLYWIALNALAKWVTLKEGSSTSPEA